MPLRYFRQIADFFFSFFFSIVRAYRIIVHVILVYRVSSLSLLTSDLFPYYYVKYFAAFWQGLRVSL